jgi:hypothetical protein
LKFFFDNNISFRFAEMLRALGEDVLALREQFPQDTKDPDLLKALSGRDVVFVSAEKVMRTHAVEAPLLREAGVTALFFGPFWSKLQFWPQAQWLVMHWPKIRGFAEGAARGTCAEVKHSGKSQIFQL